LKGCTLACAVLFTILVYSCLGHKEFRFLLPLVPVGSAFVADVFAGNGGAGLDVCIRVSEKAKVALLLLLNVPAALYFSAVHQVKETWYFVAYPYIFMTKRTHATHSRN
jgi:phosphatidylinositol glycan class B